MKKCAIVCNLKSGKGISNDSLAKMVNILLDRGYVTQIHVTKHPGDATLITEKIPHVDLLISMGGDGTYSEVITGNYKRKDKLLLTHIPIGTANDIGTMFGMNKNILTNLKNILDGVVKDVDICLVNNKPFVYVAGFGKYITISYDTPKKYKKIFGYLAYAAQGVVEFFRPTKLFEVEYTVNGETYKGLYSLILISNANSIAGIHDIYKDIKLDDKRFEIVFCNLTKRSDVIKSFYYLRTTDIDKVPGLFFHRSDNIKITFSEVPKKCWTIDGEKLQDRRKTYEFNTTYTIKMLVPKKNLAKLFVNEK